ncbi:hypothetical protein DFH09DRAFT_1377176 [Mycena vulgaris]|nr:hypothetical protein DFH09DRAFT_1377176 [Mycena vulgaris]
MQFMEVFKYWTFGAKDGYYLVQLSSNLASKPSTSTNILAAIPPSPEVLKAKIPNSSIPPNEPKCRLDLKQYSRASYAYQSVIPSSRRARISLALGAAHARCIRYQWT